MPDFQIKRGTDTQVSNYVGQEGELVKNTTTGRVHLMDGVTSGGTPLALLEDIGSGGGSTITDFESGDLSAFSGDTGSFDVNTNPPVRNGSNSLKFLAQSGDPSVSIGSQSGLANYPAVGVPHRFAWYPAASDSGANIMFSNSSTTQRADGYEIATDAGAGELLVNRRDGGSATVLDTLTLSWTTNEWHEIEVFHESDGSLTVTVFDTAGSQLAQSSGITDATYITSGAYDNPGVLVRDFRKGGDSFDYWRYVSQ